MPGILGKIEFAVGITLLAIITVLVFIAAVMRTFGHPLIWSIDLAQLLFIWVCFIGATRAMRERSHLGVDLLVRYFKYEHRLYIETALTIVFIVFLSILAVEGWKLTMLNLERLFGDSGLTYAYVTIAVPVGSVMLSIALISNLISAWRKRVDGKTLIFSRIISADDISDTPSSEA